MNQTEVPHKIINNIKQHFSNMDSLYKDLESGKEVVIPAIEKGPDVKMYLKICDHLELIQPVQIRICDEIIEECKTLLTNPQNFSHEVSEKELEECFNYVYETYQFTSKGIKSLSTYHYFFVPLEELYLKSGVEPETILLLKERFEFTTSFNKIKELNSLIALLIAMCWNVAVIETDLNDAREKNSLLPKFESVWFKGDD